MICNAHWPACAPEMFHWKVLFSPAAAAGLKSDCKVPNVSATVIAHYLLIVIVPKSLAYYNTCSMCWLRTGTTIRTGFLIIFMHPQEYKTIGLSPTENSQAMVAPLFILWSFPPDAAGPCFA